MAGMEGPLVSSHTCHWPGCSREVPPRMWGCRAHWFTLPKRLRDAVWLQYVPGQEDRKDPSPAYLEVADRVQQWCLGYEHGLISAEIAPNRGRDWCDGYKAGAAYAARRA